MCHRLVRAFFRPHADARIHGTDAQGFLSSQLSGDPRRVDAAHSQFAAWCNTKGRIITLTRAFKRDADYCLLLPAGLRGTVREHLRASSCEAKVIIEGDDNLVILGVSGPQADSLLRASGVACTGGDGRLPDK